MRIAHGEQRNVFAAGGRAPRDGRRGQAGGVRAQLSTLRGQQPVQHAVAHVDHLHGSFDSLVDQRQEALDAGVPFEARDAGVARRFVPPSCVLGAGGDVCKHFGGGAAQSDQADEARRASSGDERAVVRRRLQVCCRGQKAGAAAQWEGVAVLSGVEAASKIVDVNGVAVSHGGQLQLAGDGEPLAAARRGADEVILEDGELRAGHRRRTRGHILQYVSRRGRAPYWLVA